MIGYYDIRITQEYVKMARKNLLDKANDLDLDSAINPLVFIRRMRR